MLKKVMKKMFSIAMLFLTAGIFCLIPSQSNSKVENSQAVVLEALNNSSNLQISGRELLSQVAKVTADDIPTELAESEAMPEIIEGSFLSNSTETISMIVRYEDNLSWVSKFFNYISSHEDMYSWNIESIDIYLCADLDFSGRLWTPINGFSGNFYGLGHTISNITITDESCVGVKVSADEYIYPVGLFGATYLANIYNLELNGYFIDNTTRSAVLVEDGKILSFKGKIIGGSIYNPTYLRSFDPYYPNGGLISCRDNAIVVSGEGIPSCGYGILTYSTTTFGGNYNIETKEVAGVESGTKVYELTQVTQNGESVGTLTGEENYYKLFDMMFGAEDDTNIKTVDDLKNLVTEEGVVLNGTGDKINSEFLLSRIYVDTAEFADEINQTKDKNAFYRFQSVYPDTKGLGEEITLGKTDKNGNLFVTYSFACEKDDAFTINATNAIQLRKEVLPNDNNLSLYPVHVRIPGYKANNLNQINASFGINLSTGSLGENRLTNKVEFDKQEDITFKLDYGYGTRVVEYTIPYDLAFSEDENIDKVFKRAGYTLTEFSSEEDSAEPELPLSGSVYYSLNNYHDKVNFAQFPSHNETYNIGYNGERNIANTGSHYLNFAITRGGVNKLNDAISSVRAEAGTLRSYATWDVSYSHSASSGNHTYTITLNDGYSIDTSVKAEDTTTEWDTTGHGKTSGIYLNFAKTTGTGDDYKTSDVNNDSYAKVAVASASSTKNQDGTTTYTITINNIIGGNGEIWIVVETEAVEVDLTPVWMGSGDIPTATYNWTIVSGTGDLEEQTSDTAFGGKNVILSVAPGEAIVLKF